MYWYEVPILMNEEGGLFVSWNGVQGDLPPGSRLHVKKADPDPPATGLLGCVQALPLKTGWTALDLVGAQALFETYYGVAPTEAEVQG
jgi:hypothetical protein